MTFARETPLTIGDVRHVWLFCRLKKSLSDSFSQANIDYSCRSNAQKIRGNNPDIYFSFVVRAGQT